MNLYFIVVILLILFALELLYFKIADHFNIIDKPNHRSSHTSVTIRGGGIIFSLSLLFLYPFFARIQYPYFSIGLFIISLISFMDDIKHVSNRVRILFHLIAVALLFWQLNLYILPFYWIIIALVFVIGTINAINFMDGINGITGIYSLVTLGTLYYVNTTVNFIAPSLILIAFLSVLVFGFFNFRIKARCFAGDVGSVGIAFIILFLILQLINITQNINYILLLFIYGLDAFSTIIFRIIRKENIFEAHRSHFYQYWANNKKKPHLLVAALYGFSQLIINYLILAFKAYSLLNFVFIMISGLIVFVGVRFLTEGYKHLTTSIKIN